MSVEPHRTAAEIENLLAENRTFPPDPAFAAQANATADLYAEAERDSEAFWATARPRADRLGRAVRHDARVGPAVRQVVHRRQAEHQRTTASTATCERGLGDKVAYHWIGEPGDTRTITYADLQREVQKAANALKELGIDDRRSRRDLHADDPRAADRDARLRPDRRAAHGRLRRLLGRGAGGPDQRRPGQAGHHRRRRLAARQGDAPQGRRRRRASRTARRSSTSSMVRRLGDEAPDDDGGRGPRRVVARHRRPPGRRLPARPGRLRAHALPALHLGHDGQAQGHHAHDRGLSPRDELSPTR